MLLFAREIANFPQRHLFKGSLLSSEQHPLDKIICFPVQSSELQLLVYPDPRHAYMCQCFLLSHQFLCLVKFHRNKCELLQVKDIVVCLHLGGCSISDLVKSIK